MSEKGMLTVDICLHFSGSVLTLLVVSVTWSYNLVHVDFESNVL